MIPVPAETSEFWGVTCGPKVGASKAAGKLVAANQIGRFGRNNKMMAIMVNTGFSPPN
jgi:hypothetical protein